MDQTVLGPSGFCHIKGKISGNPHEKNCPPGTEKKIKCPLTSSTKFAKSYLDLRDIGTQYPSKVIIVDADAPLVCPIDTLSIYKIAGGTCFTLLMMFIAISYLVVGVLVHFIRTHIIEFPNHKFWIEFVLCLETGIDFVISCGKIRDNYHEYDISI